MVWTVDVERVQLDIDVWMNDDDDENDVVWYIVYVRVLGECGSFARHKTKLKRGDKVKQKKGKVEERRKKAKATCNPFPLVETRRKDNKSRRSRDV